MQAQHQELSRRFAAAYGLAQRPEWEVDLPRVVAQVAAAHALSEADVLQQVAGNPDLLRQLAGALSVDESYFFRHPEHFDVLAAAVQQRVVAGGTKPIVIWSAGCSRGEEPYSVAIALHEQLLEWQLAQVRIIGTDISVQALAAGREGVFTSWSLRTLDEKRRRRYFQAASGQSYRLDSAVFRLVQLDHASVQEFLARTPARSIDYIFFRNVAIYLAPEALQELYPDLASRLAPEGLLFTSPTDTPPPAGFERLRRHTSGAAASIYRVADTMSQRRTRRSAALVPAAGAAVDGASAAPASGPTSTAAAAPVSMPLSAPASMPLSALASMPLSALTPMPVSAPPPVSASAPTAARKREPPRPATAPRPDPLQPLAAFADPESNQDCDAALALLAGPNTAAALPIAERLVCKHPTVGRAYLVRGLVFLVVGQYERALEDMRRTVFLDPDDCLGRYWYALALNTVGEQQRALIQIAALARALEALGPGSPVPNARLPADHLLVEALRLRQ